jgi:hypothetical protein
LSPSSNELLLYAGAFSPLDENLRRGFESRLNHVVSMAINDALPEGKSALSRLADARPPGICDRAFPAEVDAGSAWGTRKKQKPGIFSCFHGT